MAGKHMESRKRIKLSTVLVIAAALALVTAIGGTMAWLTTHSEGLTNTFSAANLYAEVQENFDGTTKADVRVYNGYTDKNNKQIESEADVYVRVALVPTWQDANNNAVAMSASLSDLNIQFGNAKWALSSDGYYYYIEKVAAGATTEVLIKTAEVNTNSEGYKAGYQMNLQILVQTIQAEPDNAVLDAWKTGVSGVNNGSLTIK